MAAVAAQQGAPFLRLRVLGRGRGFGVKPFHAGLAARDFPEDEGKEEASDCVGHAQPLHDVVGTGHEGQHVNAVAKEHVEVEDHLEGKVQTPKEVGVEGRHQVTDEERDGRETGRQPIELVEPVGPCADGPAAVHKLEEEVGSNHCEEVHDQPDVCSLAEQPVHLIMNQRAMFLAIIKHHQRRERQEEVVWEEDVAQHVEDHHGNIQGACAPLEIGLRHESKDRLRRWVHVAGELLCYPVHGPEGYPHKLVQHPQRSEGEEDAKLNAATAHVKPSMVLDQVFLIKHIRVYGTMVLQEATTVGLCQGQIDPLAGIALDQRSLVV
mmetsp:Transcript_2865/g.5671  ORF Transcript_2865/g.5671 Transcript_2865/m.5671 type:complete len:323 (-) Transcript_2865:444-1412(-)